MAVPAYTTDLATITESEVLGTFVEPTGFTGGTAPIPEDACFIQNPGSGTTHAMSKPMGTGATAQSGAIFDSASGKTIPSPGAAMFWCYFASPNALALLADGGYQIFIGSAATDFQQWYVLGSDNYQLGGWRCIPVDPVVAQSTQTGTPSGTLQWFGTGAKLVIAITKGNPFGLDAIRYGRCESRIAAGSGADGYATFAGFVTTNDLAANKWGLLQSIPGGYLLQGLCVIGYGGTCNFRDLNRNVLVSDCTKVISSFNAIEIRGAASVVDMTAIAFTALGTTSRGIWITTDNADVNLDACVFTDMGTFGLLSGTTALNCIFRRTDMITTGGATLTGCTIDSNRATTAVLANETTNAEKVSNCAFTSDGTGYGLEITGTTASMTLTNCTWNNYAASDGSTGNEAVFVNTTGGSGSMNLTISGGTRPSIRVAAGVSVTVVESSRTIKVAVNDVDGPVTGANVFLAAAAGGPFPSNVTVTEIVNSGTTATVTHASHGMATNDQVLISGASLDANNGVFTITKDAGTDTYHYTMGSTPGSSPTGTIKSTFVFLKGLASAGTGSNEISMSRAIPSSQPVTGWARKSSDPFYKEGAISGDVSSTGDTTFSPVLISDD